MLLSEGLSSGGTGFKVLGVYKGFKVRLGLSYPGSLSTANGCVCIFYMVCRVPGHDRG